MALNANFKKHWIKELRKGSFTQTNGYLRVTPGQERVRKAPVGYCCLGVACEVSRKLFPNIPVDRALERMDFPTERQMKAWGLDSGEATVLAEINDNRISFKQIADWIEKNL